MIDFGLLFSIAVALGTPELLAHRWHLETFDEPTGFIDVAAYPALAGLAIGRLAAVALDDPESLGRISNLVIVRSGVEFWPGVVAASLVVLVVARRAGVRPIARLADVVPLAMVGYAAYEAACVLRDGCFGPRSPIGLRPKGLSTTVLPIGLLVALVVVGAAVGTRALSKRGVGSTTVVLVAGASVAAVRAIASIWLPHVGSGVTRQHATSIAVAVALASALAGFTVAGPRLRPAAATARLSTGRSRSADSAG